MNSALIDKIKSTEDHIKQLKDDEILIKRKIAVLEDSLCEMRLCRDFPNHKT